MVAGVVIIGAGHAGSQLAASLRQEGYDRSVVLVDCESQIPYHKPPLSKTFIKDANVPAQVLRPDAFYRDKAVELQFGVHAVRIDRHARHVELNDGRRLAYEHLVLATGARTRTPPISGINLGGVMPLRTLADATAIRQSIRTPMNVVVIGGGFIGMEIAYTFAALGLHTTVVEMASRVLERAVAPLVSQFVHADAVEAGVKIELRTAVTAIEGTSGHAKSVTLSDGRVLAADLVVLGAGVVPNDQLASGTGLETRDGVLVDDALRTSDPRVFAIGDVARYDHPSAKRSVRLESVQNATDQARHVAAAILGREGPYRRVPWFWSDLGTVKLQMAGLAGDADNYLVSGAVDTGTFSVWCFQGQTLVSVDSVNRAADHITARRLFEREINPAKEDILAGPAHLKALLAGS